VVRPAVAEVRFRSDARREFSVRLVRNRTVASHTVEIVGAGDGEVIIEGFHIAQPPLNP